MSDYSALDSHSRNCSSCQKLRDADGSSNRKRRSLQEGKCKKMSQSFSSSCSATPKDIGSPLGGTTRQSFRRSNSSLSCTSTVSVGKEEGNQEATSSYLTPTQRKNQEVRRVRLELGQATQQLEEKDKEIANLQRQLITLKRRVSEDKNITENGAKNEEDTSDEFELMETALKEEEEIRHKLQDENRRLSEELEKAKEQIKAAEEKLDEEKKNREHDLRFLKMEHDEEDTETRRERSQKEAELVRELAESSLRCARQQEIIEQRQGKEEEMKAALDELKKKLKDEEDTVARLKSENSEKTVEQNTIEKEKATETKDLPNKDDNITNENNSNEYLLSKTDSICATSQTESIVVSDASCQTESETETTKKEDIGLEDVPLSDDPDASGSLTSDEKVHFTYQFLRRSVFYFLTDRDNSAYHLKSIERLLEFTDLEMGAINKLRPNKSTAARQTQKRY